MLMLMLMLVIWTCRLGKEKREIVERLATLSVLRDKAPRPFGHRATPP
jgi:hypothetical protein